MSFVKENSMCYKCGEYGACHLNTSDNWIKGHLCDICFEKRLRFTSMIFNRRRDDKKLVKIPVKKVINN